MCRILLRQRDQHPPFSQSRAGDRSGFTEVEVNMGAWEDFHQDWRVYCLLQSVTEPEPPDGSPRERARASRSGGPLISVGQVTGHLGRELLDAVRIHALVLGIVIDSAHADVAVMPARPSLGRSPRRSALDPLQARRSMPGPPKRNSCNSTNGFSAPACGASRASTKRRSPAVSSTSGLPTSRSNRRLPSTDPHPDPSHPGSLE